MLKKVLKIINAETIKFFLMMDILSQLSMGGYKPISSLDEGDIIDECVYYDDQSGIANFMNGTKLCRAIDPGLVDEEYHKENEKYFDKKINTNSKYWVYVVVSIGRSEEEPLIQIILDDETFLIQNGLVFQA